MKGFDLVTDGRRGGVWCFVFLLALLLVGQCRCLADFPTNGIVTLADPLMKLSLKGRTNGQAAFNLSGETGVNYVIESSPNLVNWTAVATNPATTNLTLAVASDAAYFRVSRSPLPLCAYALATLGNCDMNGNGLVTDSFNSTDSKYSTNGSVVGVSGVINLGNHTILGNLYLGPTATYNSSGTVSGNVYTDQNIQFADVALPNVAWQAAPPIRGFHDFTASGYYAVNDTAPMIIEPGVVAILKLTATSFDPALMNIRGGMTNSGTAVIYHVSGSMSVGGTSQVGAPNGQPRNCIYLGLPGVTNITLSGTSPGFTGVIYAPEAALSLSGGAGSGGVIGSCTAGAVKLSGSCSFHFDESLMTAGPFR